MRAPRKLFALLVGLSLLTLLSIGSPACAEDDAHTVSLKLDWLPVGQHGPIYLAAEKGWFKKAGLDVTIVPGNGSVTTVQLVNAGKFDLGWASLASMAAGHSQGMSLVAVACIFRKLDLALLVPEDSSVKKPADVKGMKLIFTGGSFEGPYIDTFLEKGGLTRDQVTLLNLSFAARVSTYVSGGADGLFGGAIGDFVSVSPKRPSRRILFADNGINVPSFGFFATPEMLKKKGDAIRRVVSIVAGSWTYTLDGHEDEAVQAEIHANPQARLDPAILLKQIQLSKPFMFTPATANLPIGVQSAEDWETGMVTLEKAKIVAPGAKASDYFTNDYIDVNLIKKIAAGG
jgi:NitT/TauT family transport system substrate-binding protein